MIEVQTTNEVILNSADVCKMLLPAKQDRKHVREVVYDGKDHCYGAIFNFPTTTGGLWFAAFAYDDHKGHKVHVRKEFLPDQIGCHMWLKEQHKRTPKFAEQPKQLPLPVPTRRHQWTSRDPQKKYKVARR
jgi:hypothetical protein